MLHLILVRHGETSWNKQRRYQGQSDVPLNALGHRQAELAARRLADYDIDAIYASDLKRALETAEPIAVALGLAIKAEPRLRELNFGILEGMGFDEAHAKHPDVINAWIEDYDRAPEGGEGHTAFGERVRSFLEDLKRDHQGETVMLVAHGGSLAELIRQQLGLEPKKVWSFEMGNASVSELVIYDEEAVLKRLNDVSHLRELAAEES